MIAIEEIDGDIKFLFYTVEVFFELRSLLFVSDFNFSANYFGSFFLNSLSRFGLDEGFDIA